MPTDDYEHPEIVEIHEPRRDDTAKRNDTGADTVDPADLPIIQFSSANLPDVVDRAEQVLINSGLPIYGRSTQLVRVHTRLEEFIEAGVKRPDGLTAIIPFEKSSLIELLMRAARWQRYDKHQREWVDVVCPSWVAETLLARNGVWKFPELRSIITAPTLRDDGSVLDKPGYDVRTGLLFETTRKWLRIPARPTKEEAEAARDKLLELISGFPFVSEADKSAALALLLTALVRASLPSAPMFGAGSPTAGTGKGKLVDIASMLATGRRASVTMPCDKDDEVGKAVCAALILGDTFFSFDNLERPLKSPFLCQLLTQERIKHRVLGYSKKVDLPTVALVTATGNGLTFAGDLIRRVVSINIDAKCEFPEERVFDEDALDVAREKRVEFVVAGLTILRAYAISGAKPKPKIGSFERWSDRVRSALVWLDMADPYANISRVRDDDPERVRLDGILTVMEDQLVWSVADVAVKLHEEQSKGKDQRPFSDAFVDFIDRAGSLATVRLGTYLHHRRDRVVNGRKLIKAGADLHSKTVRWEVEVLKRPAESAEGSG